MHLKNTIGLLLLMSSLQGPAQKGSITGYIGDGQTKTPLSGINIALPEAGLTDPTEHLGVFQFINLPAGQC